MRVFSCFLIAAAALSGADILKLSKLPLVFEPNQGQVDSQVRFLARGGGVTLFLTDREAVMSLKGAEPVRMSLVGGAKPKEFERLEPTGGISNYFIGNDPSKWRTEIPQYKRVKFSGVYPGVDLVYYGDGGKLEYDLLVAPGADASRIEITYQGVESIRVDKQGDLLLKTAAGELRQQRPKVYQQDNGKRIEVEARYRLHGRKQVAFELARYDRAKPLVIDPVLVYSTYLGGSGNDYGQAVAVDGSGNAYVTGNTTSTNFPTANPLQGTNRGTGFGDNVFVTKINAGGSLLLYSTYLGGSNDDDGLGIAVDGSGNAYVTGQASSTNFPTASPLQGTYGGGAADAFVTKINASGSALVYSTYLGGSGYDYAHSIAVDGSGNAYVTGWTYSADFPTASPLQGALGGTVNAFVTKINAGGSAKVYSTYLGGSGTDWGTGIAVDGSGNAYVTGYTTSTNFPTASPLQGTYGGGTYDVFVTKINASGSALLYSTYLGGSGTDLGGAIAVDGSGNAYVTGYTTSTDFKTVNPLQTFGGVDDAFVTKINASGSALIYSTYLGGSGADYAFGIAVDGSGNAYVTGGTASTDFPTASPLQGTYGGGSYDAFVTKINAGGSALLYSTYLGGSGLDVGQTIAVDGGGDVYVTGQTSSTNFPTANPFQAGNQGNSDAFVFVISGSAPTEVPNVVGLSQAAATTAITNVGLVLGTVSMAASGTVPAGDVISESPVAGTGANLATAVNLVVSTGPAQVSVPNVVGLTQAAATTAITGAGLLVGMVTMISSNTVPSGSVISVSPVAGTLVNAGSAVNLVVSSGPAQVLVPNVEGSTQAAATTGITGAGLIVGTVTTASSNTVPSGSVISVSPVAGTLVNAGSAVNLVVSSGPALPSTPILTSPANVATGVSLAPSLNWNASTGATSYDVHFGTSSSPPLITNTNSLAYSPATLSGGVTYYWQIVARNSGGTTPSTIWSFTTQLLPTGPVIPVLDFNGDGKQDVFLYDPVNGGAYAGLSNGTGGFNYIFNFFTPGVDTIRYSNLTNSGHSSLVAYNSTTTIGYALLGSGTGTFSSAVSVFWGPGFTKVAAGDLNGDGLTDFVIYRPTDGTSYTAISNGDGTFRYQYALVSGGFTHVVLADFNGDGKADVLFYRSTDGLAFLGISNGTGGFTFSPVSLSAGYTFVEAGDINGDGKADLLLYSGTSGEAAVGLSTGSSFTFTPYLYSPGFTTVKLFDFNGDGKADVAVYNMNTAIGYLGISNGTSAFTYSSLFWGPGFSIVNALDLNGDGKIDIVIYNTSNAAAYTAISSGNPANPFTYQYSFWGTGKALATATAQP